MGDRVVRLVTEIETSQVSTAVKKMEADTKAAVSGMDKAVKGTQTSVEQLGGSVGGIAKHAATAGRALSAAIGASTAAAAASERSWVSLGTAVLSSFAAGGPIAGGIAIVGAGIGMIAGESKKAEEAANASKAAHRAWLKGVEEDAKRAAAEIAKMRDAEQASRTIRSGGVTSVEQVSLTRELSDARAAQAKATADEAFARERAYMFRNSSQEFQTGAGFKDAVVEAGQRRAEATAKIAEAEEKLGIVSRENVRIFTEQVEAKRRAAEATAAQARAEEAAGRISAAWAAQASSAARLRMLQTTASLPLADRGLAGPINDIREAERRAASLSESRARLERQAAELRAREEFAAGSGLPGMGAVADKFRNGLAGELGVPASGVSAELERRLKAYGSEKMALDAQLVTLRAILGISQRLTGEEQSRAAAAANKALNDETALLKIQNKFAGPIAAANLDVMGLRSAESTASSDTAKRAIEVRIAAREREVAVLDAQLAREEALAALEARLANLRDPAKNSGLTSGAIADFEAARRAQIEGAYSTAIASATAKGVAASTPAVDSAMNGLLQSIQGTLGQGLTDLLVDAITNGFRNGQQIALSLVRSLLSQVLNSIVSSGIQAAFGGLFGGGGGGGGGILSTIIGGGASLLGGGGGGGGNEVGGSGGFANIMAGIGGGGCAGGG